MLDVLLRRKYRKVVQQRLQEFEQARAKYKECQEHREEKKKRNEAITESLHLAQCVAEQVQTQAHAQITGVVNRSLQAVFDEPYIFKIKLEKKRNRTEAALVFERNGLDVDPLTASGGGVVDVAAFALRLSCLMLSRPKVRRILILDEPFKNLSKEYRPRLRQLLTALCDEMQVKILMVTHMKELKLGNVHELALD